MSDLPELRSCVKVEVAVLGSPSLIKFGALEVCENRGGRPGPVPDSPCGQCGRKATLNLNIV